MPASKKQTPKTAQQIAQEELDARLRDGLQEQIDAVLRQIRKTILAEKFPDLDFELTATPRQRVTVTLAGQPVTSHITTPVVGDGVPLPPNFND